MAAATAPAPTPSARERLLDAAEALFADHGLAGVSLRSINSAAGLSPAALHYHFCSEASLVEALLDRRMAELTKRRERLIEALESEPVAPGARAVLEALISPLAELLAKDEVSGRRYLRLLARLRADGDLDERFIMHRFGDGLERLDALLQRALPDTPVGEVRLRLGFAVELFLPALAHWEDVAVLGRSAGSDVSLDRLVDSLLVFLVGGLEAPTSATATGDGRPAHDPKRSDASASRT